MAQIFHHSMNILSRASIVGGGLLTAVLALAGIGISRSPFNTHVGVAKEQPVAFSHQHHTVELGLDCRYCHTSVEKSATAGVPPTQTCMTCHSQIWTNSPLLNPVRASFLKKEALQWNKINTVPDFVYFNHSIHVNRGLNCNTCHGTIQRSMMAYKGKAFFMAWCLDCHRTPERYVSKRGVAEIYSKEQKHQFTDEQIKQFREQDPLIAKVAEESRMTKEQMAIAAGQDYERNKDELAAGKARLQEYKVKTEQLTDCYTCHR